MDAILSIQKSERSVAALENQANGWDTFLRLYQLRHSSFLTIFCASHVISISIAYSSEKGPTTIENKAESTECCK